MIHDEYTRKATLKRVIDGDTVDLNIDLGWGITILERVRLEAVDAPEIRGLEREAGLEFMEFVEDWFAGREYVVIRSVKYKRGKYGRTIGEIYAPDGESLNARIRGLTI